MAEAVKSLRYPAYKPSGVDWLGEIPAHWSVKPLNALASVKPSNVDKLAVDGEQSVRLCNYVDVYKNETITGAIAFMPATATRAQINQFSLRRGDVLITKDSEAADDIAVPAVVAENLEGVVCGYHLSLIRPKKTCAHGPYLARYLQSKFSRAWFTVQASGVTRFGLSNAAVKSAPFLMPPLKEQRAIADWLDAHTARLDELVNKKRALIDRLKEKRAALITRAVTHGLNLDVPLKDSGVFGLEKIPAHWDIRRLRFLATAILDTEHKTAPYYPDGEFLVTRTTNIRDGQLRLADAKYTDAEGFKEWTQRGVPAVGDVMFTREAPAGEACVVPADLPLCIGQRVVLFRLKKQLIQGEFAVLSIYGGIARAFIESLSAGSTVTHFNMSEVSNIPFLLPPIEEQKQIVLHLGRTNARIDEMIANAETAIDKLTEYRAALITAAVTGKIDVRGAAAPAPAA